MLIDPSRCISVTDLTRNTSRLINETQEGEPFVVLKDSRFAAVLISFDRYQALTNATLGSVPLPGYTAPDVGECSMERPSLFSTLGIADIENFIPPWRDPRDSPFTANLPAVIGKTADGADWVIDFGEGAVGGSGPHGLVVMPNEKRESALESLVLALASSYHPDRVSFALLDRGAVPGTAFVGLAGLPHIAYADPEPWMVANAPTSHFGMSASSFYEQVNKELGMRTSLLQKHGVGSLSAYMKKRERGATHLPVPSTLFVVVNGNPNDLHELSPVVEKGRSLGVHLILGTSRPRALPGSAHGDLSGFTLAQGEAVREMSLDLRGRGADYSGEALGRLAALNSLHPSGKRLTSWGQVADPNPDDAVTSQGALVTARLAAVAQEAGISARQLGRGRNEKAQESGVQTGASDTPTAEGTQIIPSPSGDIAT
jgi:antitoxin (DNA-binding transcriptional repressor) of toxin-antitoxin stability system